MLCLSNWVESHDLKRMHGGAIARHWEVTSELRKKTRIGSTTKSAAFSPKAVQKLHVINRTWTEEKLQLFSCWLRKQKTGFLWLRKTGEIFDFLSLALPLTSLHLFLCPSFLSPFLLSLSLSQDVWYTIIKLKR